MKTRISLPAGVAVFAFLALAGLMGLFALTAAPFAEAQEDMTTIEYAENGEDPVATFTATDPEGVTPITWSLLNAGAPGDIVDADYADQEHFMIDKDGVLRFNIGTDGDPPDYEASTTGDGGGDADMDNTYHVVVVAEDTTGNEGYHKVTVKVTDVAETGKVTWTTDANADDTVDDPTLMQFQVRRSPGSPGHRRRDRWRRSR